MLQFMWLQRVGHDLATEATMTKYSLNKTASLVKLKVLRGSKAFCLFLPVAICQAILDHKAS